ncbi:MAG TPA: Ppx/GppA family phosphatase, partial [Methanospirillum sp.]|nr:Ppx/GppA family phosphatase [Methanospirillum sp.]
MHLKNPRIIGFIDLGTNSVRLLVVRLNPNGSYTLVTQQKEVIRLGEGEYLENKLTEAAMERATGVICRLINLARSRGVEEFVAVATSATREASNGEDLCNRIEEQTGVRIHIISGAEEARLIWLGVSSGIDLKGETALFI